MLLLIFIIISVVCPIINYVYLFLAFKLKFGKEFVSFLMDFCNNEKVYFITPIMSSIPTFCIIVYLMYELLLKPLSCILIKIPMMGFVWLSNILFKPINKMQFMNEIDASKSA